MTKYVVFYGERQMLAIKNHMASIQVSMCPWDWQFYFIDTSTPGHEDCLVQAAIRADVIVLQISADAQISMYTMSRLLSIKSRCAILRVPFLHMRAFWPFDQATFDPVDQEEGIPSPSYFTNGDERLAALVGEIGACNAVARYGQANLGELTNLEALLDEDIKEWRYLDLVTDIPVAEFILDNLKMVKLFGAPSMPSNALLKLLIVRIIELCNGGPEVLSASGALLAGRSILIPEAPIHPSILTHFDIEWAGEKTTYVSISGETTYSGWLSDFAERCQRLQQDWSGNNPSWKAFSSLLDVRSAGIQQSHADFIALCARTAPRSRAQLFQDAFVLYKLGEKRNGFFVEFGACDGETLSNTFMLEKDFGWSGILAEPFPFWHSRLDNNRGCIIDHRCVWTKTGALLNFTMDEAVPEFATLEEFVESDTHRAIRRRASTNIQVTTVSLDDLLSEHGAPVDIDYMSIDTEGSELDILSHFSFSRYKPKIVSIEHNHQRVQRAKLHELMTGAGYVREMEAFSHFDDWYTLAKDGRIKA